MNKHVSNNKEEDEKQPQEHIVAEALLKTSGWWIDIFAATNEEMRLLSQVS